MSKQMTLEDVRKWHAEVAGIAALHKKNLYIMRLHGAMADAIDAQVAKLRELCLTIRQDDRDMRWCASAIEDILSTEPADPKGNPKCS